MAELVDALASGASARKGMRVRVSPAAPFAWKNRGSSKSVRILTDVFYLTLAKGPHAIQSVLLYEHMKFPGFDTWRASHSKRSEENQKHETLSKKYNAEGKRQSNMPERDEGMFAKAADRAERQEFARENRANILRRLKTEYEIMDLSESDLEELAEQEMLTASELLEGLASKMKEVHAKLSHEEEIARERQGKAAQLMEEMGLAGKAFGLDQKTRERIHALDKRMRALIKLHKNVVAPSLMEAFKATGRGEEFLVPKPSEWDELMKETIGSLPPKEEIPTPAELQKYELILREDAEQLENKLGEMIDEINAQAVLKELSSMGGTVIESFNFEEAERPHVEALMKEDFEELKKAKEQIANIQLNTGMARRLEGGDMRMAA